jgi:hypothetical protein
MHPTPSDIDEIIHHVRTRHQDYMQSIQGRWQQEMAEHRQRMEAFYNRMAAFRQGNKERLDLAQKAREQDAARHCRHHWTTADAYPRQAPPQAPPGGPAPARFQSQAHYTSPAELAHLEVAAFGQPVSKEAKRMAKRGGPGFVPPMDFWTHMAVHEPRWEDR